MLWLLRRWFGCHLSRRHVRERSTFYFWEATGNGAFRDCVDEQLVLGEMGELVGMKKWQR
jgi:hypothetical protein